MMGAPTHHLARAPLRALPTLGPAGTLLTLLALRAGSACESLQTTSNRHGPGYSPRQGLCTYMYTTTASCIYPVCLVGTQTDGRTDGRKGRNGGVSLTPQRLKGHPLPVERCGRSKRTHPLWTCVGLTLMPGMPCRPASPSSPRGPALPASPLSPGRPV